MVDFGGGPLTDARAGDIFVAKFGTTGGGIPPLSQTGMILFVLMLVMAGTLFLLRRRRLSMVGSATARWWSFQATPASRRPACELSGLAMGPHRWILTTLILKC
jgi:hypothetical protein